MGSLFSRAALILLAFVFSAGGQVSAADNEPVPLYVIERDTLQTRNYVPIVNHQTMVVNLGERPVSLDLTSKFPGYLNRKGDGFPAFLEDSLVADPIFSPIEITPKKTSYLAQPELAADGKEASYSWRNVHLPPGESVVAQYDNYFGEAGHYWRDDGFDFQGVRVKTSYSAEELKGGRTELYLGFEIVNGTGQPVQDFDLGVFVPVRRLLQEKEIDLLEPDRICTSPNVEASRLTKSDGFGEAAEGFGASISIKELLPGKPEKYFICLAGKAEARSSASWPIVTVTGRSIRPAVWPPTTIRTDEPVNEARFSYLVFNIVVKDRRLFRFSPDGVKVEKAK
jgi:hypothetical protein